MCCTATSLGTNCRENKANSDINFNTWPFFDILSLNVALFVSSESVLTLLDLHSSSSTAGRWSCGPGPTPAHPGYRGGWGAAPRHAAPAAPASQRLWRRPPSSARPPSATKHQNTKDLFPLMVYFSGFNNSTENYILSKLKAYEGLQFDYLRRLALETKAVPSEGRQAHTRSRATCHQSQWRRRQWWGSGTADGTLEGRIISILWVNKTTRDLQ